MPQISRRNFLVGTTALALTPILAKANTDIQTLEAVPASVNVVGNDYPATDVWGFNGNVPGPLIRVNQGGQVKRRLLNSLPQDTAIHWHGLRLDNAMDGVPGLTQDAVKPGEEYVYDFTAPDAGTYWYHSHNQSTEQVARGLYGVLVVDEPEALDLDHDIVILVDDWRLTQEAQIADDFGQVRDWSHAGRMGNYIHARLFPNLSEVKQNQRMRLRMVNTATDRTMLIALAGVTGHVVALDGMPLIQPIPADQMVLAPAQRADFIVDVTASQGEAVQVLLKERDKTFVLTELQVVGQHSLVPRAAALPLPANPAINLKTASGARQVELKMTGGAMGGLQQAIYKGKMMSTQELVENQQIWALNGVAGLPDEPLATVSQGEVLRIPIVNDTVFAHAMHIHGTHFQEVLSDGSLGPLRDTILVQPNETREIAFTGDNPGKWLFHCHMLSHQAAGMKTWVKVLA